MPTDYSSLRRQRERQIRAANIHLMCKVLLTLAVIAAACAYLSQPLPSNLEQLATSPGAIRHIMEGK